MGKSNDEIIVTKIKTGTVRVNVLGTTPIILNRMTEKAMRQLLMPPKKGAARKSAGLKHDPYAEFCSAPYLSEREGSETKLVHLASAFKGAVKGATTDMPGATKAGVGRSVWFDGERVPIYGVPELFMSITRSAGMNRTPDVRTRCIVPRWATILEVTFVANVINEKAICDLLVYAGLTQGVGDWRPEKGSGNYGQFRLVGDDDPEFIEIVKNGGRAAQEAAIAAPECYDNETAELYEWFSSEASDRGLRIAS